MRWTLKAGKKEGDTRTVSRFLWFPKCIDREIRWLEWATIQQTVMVRTSLAPNSPIGCTYLAWVDSCWVN